VDVRGLRAGDCVCQPGGEAAEAANHHPDITVHGWNKVRLSWHHSEGGLTEADIGMAARIDTLA